MEFSAMRERALTVRKHYEAFEKQHFGRSWTTEEITLGFAGDAGDLAKLVLSQEGLQIIPDDREKLEHDIADCLWWLMILADTCKVNLEEAFGKTMDDFERALT